MTLSNWAGKHFQHVVLHTYVLSGDSDLLLMHMIVIVFTGSCNWSRGRDGVIHCGATGAGCFPPRSSHKEDQSWTSGKPLQATQKPHRTHEKN